MRRRWRRAKRRGSVVGLAYLARRLPSSLSGEGGDRRFSQLSSCGRLFYSLPARRARERARLLRYALVPAPATANGTFFSRPNGTNVPRKMVASARPPLLKTLPRSQFMVDER